MTLSNKDYHSYSSIYRVSDYSMVIHSDIHFLAKRLKLKELSLYDEVELLHGSSKIKNIHIENNKINVEL